MCGDRSVLLFVVIVVFCCVWCVSLVGWQFDVLLVLISIVNLKLYIPWFASRAPDDGHSSARNMLSV